MNIYFFDTETTGNGPTDQLVQLAITQRANPSPILNEMYKPSVPITHEASAVHHITNKMVADKPLFKESNEYASTKNLFESADNIFVAHNCSFDVGMLKVDAIVPTNTICTLKVIRSIDTERRFTNYKLQYLRYALGMELEVGAHDALADVMVLEQLFDYLLNKMMHDEHIDQPTALLRMQQITAEPSILKDIPFGKHRGKTIEEVAKTDKGYLQWLLDEKRKKPEGEEDWIFTLEKYLA